MTQALLAPFVVAAALLLPVPVSAETTCHLISSGDAVPEHFGAPYDVASASQELLLRATCTVSGATIEVGTGNKLQYIYEQGYEWRNNGWNAFKYRGSNTVGQWVIGTATATLDRTESEISQRNPVVAYVCTWTGSQWKCGCRDTPCTENYWQLQAFRLSLPSGPDQPPTLANVATEQETPSPLPKKLFYPGAKFPSSEFAPIKEPYVFGHQSVPFALAHDTYPQDALEHVRPFNINGENNRGGYYDRRNDQFRTLGILPVFLAQIKNEDDNQQTVIGIETAGRPGIMIDEFLNNSTPLSCPSWCEDTIIGLREATSRNPALFSWGWVTNVERTLPSYVTDAHQVFDVIAMEAYVANDTSFWWNIFDTAVAEVKKSGFVEKTVIGIVGGWDRGFEIVVPTESMLRRQFETIRQELPQSPGFGLWGNWQVNDDLLASGIFADLVNEYWYDRSPSVAISNLSPGQMIDGTYDVVVSGTPNGLTDKPVQYYRYFIDSKMVAESEHRTFRWNTENYSKGAHTFTVHAVDEDYLAGVAQVDVNVE